MNNIHDNTYKTMFSNPLLAQQLFEGFLPKDIHELLDYSTLKTRSSNYITPAMKNLYQDIVWSVEFQHGEERLPLYLCILLEFQSTAEADMPLRILNYVASFYRELAKQEKLNLRRDKLPPVLPVVLYSGKPRWNVKKSIQAVTHPVPKALRQFQPKLSHYLIDEHRLSVDALEQAPEILAKMITLNHSKNAKEFALIWHALERKVKSHPDYEHLNKTVARWLVYTLHLRDREIKLEEVETIDEATNMWTFESEMKRLVKEAADEAAREAAKEAAKEAAAKEALIKKQQEKTSATVRRMISRNISREDIADILDISQDEVAEYVKH